MINNKGRAKTILTIFVLTFSMLIFRLFYLSTSDGLYLKTMTNSQYSYDEKSRNLSYLLLDRNGSDLLSYKKIFTIVIDTAVFNRNLEEMNIDDVYALNYTLKNYNSTYSLPYSNEVSTKLYYKVDKDTYDKVKSIKGLKGVFEFQSSEVDRSETWKIENMITNTQKTSDGSVKDKNSIEMKVGDKISNNQFQLLEFKNDISGNIVEDKAITPKNNINVKLTIDKEIEDKISSVINKDDYKKQKQIGVVLMEANTGKVISLVQKDNKESNVILGGSGNGFVPGSIFKVIVEEASLESSKINAEDKYLCKGSLENQDEKHGSLTEKEALKVSCNDIFAQIGRKTGYENILKIANSNELLNSKKVLNFNDEAVGYFHVPNPASGDINYFSIGQSMNITPIQALSIPNTVVTGGLYVKPYIVDSYINTDNKVIESENTEKHNAISTETAEIVKASMINVVKGENGTGAATSIQDMEIGGKTGTSTRMEPSKNNPSIMEKHSDGWFAGFFKKDNKYYSMVVFVKDINTETEYAASTAVPIFKDIVLNIRDKL